MLLCETLPSMVGPEGFGGVANIYVPSSLVDSYKTATNWAELSDKILAIEDHPDIWDGGEI